MLYENFYPHDFPLLTSKDLYEILSAFKIRKTPYVICEYFNSCNKCPFFFKNTSVTRKSYKCTDALCGKCENEIDDFQITLKAIRRLFHLMNGYKKFK